MKIPSPQSGHLILPQRGRYKASLDTAVEKNGKRGYGLIIRDWRGDHILAASMGLEANWTTEMTKAMAVY